MMTVPGLFFFLFSKASHWQLITNRFDNAYNPPSDPLHCHSPSSFSTKCYLVLDVTDPRPSSFLGFSLQPSLLLRFFSRQELRPGANPFLTFLLPGATSSGSFLVIGKINVRNNVNGSFAIPFPESWPSFSLG